jgi:hypothetical protein
MNKIIVAMVAALLTTSSLAFGQTVGGDGVSSQGAATGRPVGTGDQPCLN